MAGERPAAVAVAVVSWNTRDLLAAASSSLRARGRARPGRGVGRRQRVDRRLARRSSASTSAGRSSIASDENLGFGRAVNLVAARDATRRGSRRPTPTSRCGRARSTRCSQAGPRDPGAARSRRASCCPTGATQHSVFAFPTIPFTVAARRRRLPAAAAPRRPAARSPAAGTPSGRVACRGRSARSCSSAATAWDAVGGFDERQWMYAEDLDLGWRLRRAGLGDALRAARGRRPRGRGRDGPGVRRRRRIEARWQRATYGWMARRRGARATWAVAAMNVAGSGARWLALAPAARSRRRAGASVTAPSAGGRSST